MCSQPFTMQLRQFLILLILEYSQVVLAQKVDLITLQIFRTYFYRN